MPSSTRAPSRFLALTTLLAIASACPDGDDDAPAADAAVDAGQTDAAPMAPPLRKVVTLPDDELAAAALELLGDSAEGGVCGDCHSPGQQLLRRWEAVGATALSACLTDLEVKTPASARAMLDCLRLNPKDPGSSFSAARLGPYAAAAHLGWFEHVFAIAHGTGWEDAYGLFKNRVAMPKGAHAPLSQAQFDVVAEWFARGLPLLEELVPGEPPPAGCTPGLTPAVAAHVAEMKTSGWAAVNEENGLLLHGCQGTADARACLSAYPRASSKSYGAGWEALPGTQLRVLFETDDRSSFWTRSSADGRFVASGRVAEDKSEYAAAIIDLQERRVVPTAASYDPGFFPDNSAFVFQTLDGAAFCPQRVLSTGSPAKLTLREPGCSTNNVVGLYQHVGAALAGGDYWTVHSEFMSDDGFDAFFGGFTDPSTPFESWAEVTLVPMINTGSGFEPGLEVKKNLEFEGDTVISPSARLIVSRAAGPEARQSGFVLRRVDAEPDGLGGYAVETPEIARYCQRGGKPSFSFDERWMVLHHYIEESDAVELGFQDALDPGFQAYRDLGAANVYLVDLLTGKRTRLTGMQAGQFALFPHFRSDGWIYFIVRTPEGPAGEIVVASDAALVLGAP